MEETVRGSPSCGLGGVWPLSGLDASGHVHSLPRLSSFLRATQGALRWDCTGKYSHSFWLKWKAFPNLSAGALRGLITRKKLLVTQRLENWSILGVM